jgi:hypothetical protein
LYLTVTDRIDEGGHPIQGVPTPLIDTGVDDTLDFRRTGVNARAHSTVARATVTRDPPPRRTPSVKTTTLKAAVSTTVTSEYATVRLSSRSTS